MAESVSYPKDKIKILLLEGIHPTAVQAFESAGYSVELSDAALGESDLLDLVPGVHLLGIRSKTKISA
ncbi:MAG: phosphoglycerate dehydrogenase, partial [Bdellovibrionales bacterium]|nr:phosphoglycerate dehydrogenase [Bdellovibrionales bacterium]